MKLIEILQSYLVKYGYVVIPAIRKEKFLKHLAEQRIKFNSYQDEDAQEDNLWVVQIERSVA